MDEIGGQLCKGFLAANIPLKKLQHPVLREILETNMAIKLPCETTFRAKFVPSCYEDVWEAIKRDLKDGPLWICPDATKDALGREVCNIIVGKLDSQCYHKPHLVNVGFMDKVNGESIARLVNDTLRKLDPEFDSERALIYVSDGAPYMLKSGRDLKIFFPQLHHILCICHGLSLVSEVAMDYFADVNRLIASVKQIFCKAPNRRTAYHEGCPNLPLPPEPVKTR